MTTLTESVRPVTPAPVASAPVVEIVVPVHDEEREVGPFVRRLHAFLAASSPCAFLVTVADHGSTDGTWGAARFVAATLPGVRAVRVAGSGRGDALRAVWSRSEAFVVAEVGTASDLGALLPLLGPLLSGESDVAAGARLHAGRTETVRRLLPLVVDTGWFFDTELLVLAERAGLRIHAVR
jgi:hypothetical protein